MNTPTSRPTNTATAVTEIRRLISRCVAESDQPLGGIFDPDEFLKLHQEVGPDYRHRMVAFWDRVVDDESRLSLEHNVPFDLTAALYRYTTRLLDLVAAYQDIPALRADFEKFEKWTQERLRQLLCTQDQPAAEKAVLPPEIG